MLPAASAPAASARTAWLESLAKRPELAVLACVVVASLAFRIYVSRHCSLWFDEVWTRRDASVPWVELLRGPSREHPPLMYLLVRLTLDLLGTSETSLRSTSLFFGCALLVAVYFLCLELELGATPALVTVASLALSPFFIRHATEARQYAMLATFTTLATVYTLRLLRKPGSFGDLVGFAASAAAAAATQYFGLAYAAALVGALAVGTFPSFWHSVSARRVPLRSALVLLGLFVALGLVVVRALLLIRFYSDHTLGPHGRDLLGSMLREFAFFDERGGVIEACLSACGLVLCGFRLRGIARVLPFALVFPPCALALRISTGHAVDPRYLAASFVLFHVGAAVALLGAWAWLRGAATGSRAVRWARSLAAAPVLLVPLCVRLAEYPAGYGAGREYYAGLQTYFGEARGRATALVVTQHYPGEFIVNEGYPIDAPMLSLDTFEPLPGIKRYLVATFHRHSAERHVEDLLRRHFGISAKEWRALPLVALAHSKFQPAVQARLVRLTAGRDKTR